MAGTLKDPEEDKTGRDGGVEDTQEDQCRDHERKGNFLKQFITQRSKGRSRVVLCSGISVNDRAHQAEENDFCDGDGPEGLGEVIRVFHLSDEAGNSDLADEGITDVQERAHTTDESGARSGNDEDSWLTNHAHFWSFSDTYASVIIVRMLLNPGKDSRQQDGNKCEECRKRCQFRESVECPRQRANEAYNSHDGRKTDSTYAAVSHCIEIFGAGQNV